MNDLEIPLRSPPDGLNDTAASRVAPPPVSPASASPLAAALAFSVTVIDGAGGMIRSHISSAGHVALQTLLVKLAKGEQVIVTSTEDLIGGQVKAKTATGEYHDYPMWLVAIVMLFAAIGIVHLGIDTWQLFH